MSVSHDMGLPSPERDAAWVQQELGISVPAAAALAHRGQYTAEQFQRLNPDKYDLVLHLLGCAWSKEHIRTVVGCAWETVDAVSKSPDAAGKIREVSLRIADLCESITEAGLQSLLTKAIAGKLSALDVKLVFEVGQLAKGLPTCITDGSVKHVTLDDFTAALKQLRDVTPAPGMGSGGGEILTLPEAGLGLPGTPALEAEVLPREEPPEG